MNHNGKQMKLEATCLTRSESAKNFKSFQALHNTVLDIDDQLLSSNIQTKVGQMYDELQ